MNILKKLKARIQETIQKLELAEIHDEAERARAKAWYELRLAHGVLDESHAAVCKAIEAYRKANEELIKVREKERTS